mmetsp:Transcript_15198/g.37483  ORF Transcript_15198/g.37483 Transcript_15198/m.37483 type:complete len:201 (-) Transcript_15198:4348-4950(-)
MLDNLTINFILHMNKESLDNKGSLLLLHPVQDDPPPKLDTFCSVSFTQLFGLSKLEGILHTHSCHYLLGKMTSHGCLDQNRTSKLQIALISGNYTTGQSLNTCTFVLNNDEVGIGPETSPCVLNCSCCCISLFLENCIPRFKFFLLCDSIFRKISTSNTLNNENLSNGDEEFLLSILPSPCLLDSDSSLIFLHSLDFSDG